jgi:hypothetical protein
MAHAHRGGSGCRTIVPFELKSKVLAEADLGVPIASAMVSAMARIAAAY